MHNDTAALRVLFTSPSGGQMTEVASIMSSHPADVPTSRRKPFNLEILITWRGCVHAPGSRGRRDLPNCPCVLQNKPASVPVTAATTAWKDEPAGERPTLHFQEPGKCCRASTPGLLRIPPHTGWKAVPGCHNGSVWVRAWICAERRRRLLACSSPDPTPGSMISFYVALVYEVPITRPVKRKNRRKRDETGHLPRSKVTGFNFLQIVYTVVCNPVF